MRILITGAAGFLGRNLSYTLKYRPDTQVLEYRRGMSDGALEELCAQAEFVFHLAGVNRPEDPAEFMTCNAGLTQKLLQCLQRRGNCCPVVLASSVHAAGDSPYGKSKRSAEELVFAHGRQTGVRVLVYRLPNLFGKWCRPHYNSVVATFCHQIARGEPITLDDPARELELAWVEDVMEQYLAALEGKECRRGEFCAIPVTHRVTLGRIAALLETFRDRTLWIPEMPADSFEKKLYSTYLSYLPEDGLLDPLVTHADHRGSFTELLKTENCGQFSVNITKPGITKGDHWHHSKWEQFTVVSGEGCIRLRKLGTDRVLTYDVTGDAPKTVHIPPGYTHSITNCSDSRDLVTLIWANEPFDPEAPDTFPERVE